MTIFDYLDKNKDILSQSGINWHHLSNIHPEKLAEVKSLLYGRRHGIYAENNGTFSARFHY